MSDTEQTISNDNREQAGKITNPEGKGGFGDHPENINVGGRPKYAQSITAWYRQFLDMPKEIFLSWEKENLNPPVAAGIAYARVLAARNSLKDTREITDRTDGKPKQTIDVDMNAVVKTISNKELADKIDNIITEGDDDEYEDEEAETPQAETNTGTDTEQVQE